MTSDQVFKDESNRRAIYSALDLYGWGLSEDDRSDVIASAIRRSIERFDCSKQKFTSQLFRFVCWDCRNKHRYNKRRGGRHVSLSDIPEPAMPVGDREEDMGDVRECMGMLPEDDRQLISLYYLHSMSLREIGRLQGCSHQWVKRRLESAMGRLRALCSPGGG